MLGISVGIPTKGRYDVLDKALLSIAFQTKLPLEVLIIDDTDNPIDIRTISHYEYILRLFDDKRIKWRVIWGAHKGQHYSHQLVQEEAIGDLIYRNDDDCILEPDVLEKLYNSLINSADKTGAVAPCVLMPNPTNLPKGLRNRIDDLNSPNMQWFKGTGEYRCEHLYSCFLYRKGIAKYDLSLSNKAFREETILTHSIYREGYNLLVNMDAVVWHFRGNSGGIRTDNRIEDYEHDERIFQGYLNRWGVNKKESKMIILDAGMGDHYAFKHILPLLQKMHKNITIAACYPEVFYDDENIKLISVAEAKLIYGNIDNFNIYKWMGDRNWSGTLVEAFKQLYLDENNSVSVFKTPEKWEGESEKLSGGILDSGYKLIGA